MLAARPYRDRFRRALGVRRGQRLVLLNSTWSPRSLLGDGDTDGDDSLPALLPRLMSELPADEFRVAAVLHPNIWHGHGPGQIRAWLDRARRCGLALIDPLEDWRQALVAADLVIGDHTPQPGPPRFTSSVPGEAAARLRRVFYELMGAPEPPRPALLVPLPLPAPEPARRTAPLRVLTRLRAGAEVAVTRYADPVREPAGAGEAHLAAHEDTRDPGQLDVADVIFRDSAPDDPRLGPPGRWTAEVLARHPHCALAAYVTGPASCVVRTRDGALLRLTAGADGDADPAAYASAVHAWLATGRTRAALPADGLTVRTGSTVHHVVITAEVDETAPGDGTRQAPPATPPVGRSTAHADGADAPRAGRRSPRTGS
ncbi:hypothetical protein [Streptomyces globisporus]